MSIHLLTTKGLLLYHVYDQIMLLLTQNFLIEKFHEMYFFHQKLADLQVRTRFCIGIKSPF